MSRHSSRTLAQQFGDRMKAPNVKLGGTANYSGQLSWLAIVKRNYAATKESASLNIYYM